MYIYVKRFLDILFSFILLLILSPLMVLIALLIRLSIGNPIFFMQVRAGKDNVKFSIIKFRTLSNNPRKNMTDKQRLTKLGAILRKASLDELPQIINIFKGDMSFIGPRPLLVDYLPYYNSREILRHKIRPGMSSLAGINGRSNLTWEEQFEMDVYYVENLSFFLDLKILLKTIPRVMASSDVMVVGRKDKDRFDIHRKKQIDALQPLQPNQIRQQND
jgi:undecaprenyl phosphate N,N'-diacetylbacillosamine 1-phosphate transferase